MWKEGRRKGGEAKKGGRHLPLKEKREKEGGEGLPPIWVVGLLLILFSRTSHMVPILFLTRREKRKTGKGKRKRNLTSVSYPSFHTSHPD